MDIWKWVVKSTAVIFFSVGMRSQPVNTDPNASLLVSGEIVRSKESFDYKGAVVFAEDAHAVVRLAYVSAPIDMTGGGGTPEADVLLVTQRIENIAGFPIPFRLEGDPEEVFRFPAHAHGTGGYYSVSATVYMGTDSELHIGDFDNAFLNVIYGPTSEVQLKLSRLERCGSPKPAAFCASEQRPR